MGLQIPYSAVRFRPRPLQCYALFVVDLKKVKPENLWYTVGFIAADGNLSLDKRHINITSKDLHHLRKIRTALGLKNKIIMKARAFDQKRKYGALQFGDVKFYHYLEKIGLTSNKSLTLGKLIVPDEYFLDFLRGVIDGDGNIHRWLHSQNGGEQWELRISSAAPEFSRWLFEEMCSRFGVRGILVMPKVRQNASPMHVIKFGKMAARQILTHCYYEPSLALERKRKLAKACIESYRGWSRSFTINIQAQAQVAER